MDRMDIEALAAEVYLIAEKAGIAIVQGLNNAIEITYKVDRSIVTNLDRLANQIIVQRLQSISDYPILSEEQIIPPYEERAGWSHYWCIDPLDGTKDLIEGTGEYTVNIALISNHRPVLGIVYVPEQKIGFLATKDAAYKIDAQYHKIPMHTRSKNQADWIIALSRFHHGNQAILDKMACLPGATVKLMGSSLKICQIAAGEIDCYPRIGSMHDWDLAAAHIILEAAGGGLFDLTFQSLAYNTQASLLQPSFIAVGDLNADWSSVLQYYPVDNIVD